MDRSRKMYMDKKEEKLTKIFKCKNQVTTYEYLETITTEDGVIYREINKRSNKENRIYYSINNSLLQ